MKLKQLDAIGKPYQIYAEYLESGAIEQFVSTMAQDFVVKGALMPDAHAGYVMPVGGVVAAKDVLVPAYVGYDNGCGVCGVCTSFDADAVRHHAHEIFDRIYATIPVGFAHHSKPQPWKLGEQLDKSPYLEGLIKERGLCDLHTVGGGNHFLEVGFDENNQVWIAVHSGSRGLGHTMAKHYMTLAASNYLADKAKSGNIEGHFPLDVHDAVGRAYAIDLAYALEFALENRRGIIRKAAEIIRDVLGAGDVIGDSLVNRNHNHAELRMFPCANGGLEPLYVHRKGATHAERGMRGIVPGSMRDGFFIVEGKGNPDSIYSSSHGAGRVMSRSQAKKRLDMDTFKAEMAARGIVARIEEATLDESAGAYKSIFDVMAQQQDLVEVVHHVKPIINIKG